MVPNRKKPSCGALAKVGESITFSAATVVAALLSLMLGQFRHLQGSGTGIGHRAGPHAARVAHVLAGTAGGYGTSCVLAVQNA